MPERADPDLNAGTHYAFVPRSDILCRHAYEDARFQAARAQDHAGVLCAAWEKTVADAVTVLRSKHVIAAPGLHVLEFWATDPALVVQKLVVDTGGLRPSYLGPPESVHRVAAEATAGGRGTR